MPCNRNIPYQVPDWRVEGVEGVTHVGRDGVHAHTPVERVEPQRVHRPHVDRDVRLQVFSGTKQQKRIKR